MKVINIIFGIVFALLLFTTCRKHQLKAPCDCNNNILVTSDVEIEGEWIFQSFVTSSGKQKYSSTGFNEMNIEISPDLSFKFAAAINSGGGNYILYQNNCILIESLGGTQKGGPHDQ